MRVLTSRLVTMKEHKTGVQNNQRVQYTRAARKRSETEWNKSAITDHTNKENHVINWDKTKVLAKKITQTKKVDTGSNRNKEEGPHHEQGPGELPATTNLPLFASSRCLYWELTS